MMLRRLLLSKCVEVYEIKESLYSEVQFYMIFVDLRRISKYQDFPYLNEVEKDDFTPRSNFIQSIILYHDKITDSDKDVTYEIASGFLESKEDCDWSMRYIESDFNKLKLIATNDDMLLEKVGSLLTSLGYENSIGNIDIDTFNYLFQE